MPTAKTGAEIELGEFELTVRDYENQEVDVSFNVEYVAKGAPIPTSFVLSQNYPNPFNASTNIQFGLPVASDYQLSIYNVLGQVVKSFRGRADAGYVTIKWNADDLSSGIYLYRLIADNFQSTRKMVLMK